MQKSALYPPVYVLGNGQLGRMLNYAGAPLDIAVQPLDFSAPLFAIEDNAVITAEIERWPATALTTALSSHPNFINKNVFGLLADRYSQKSLLDELNLATSPWQLLNSTEEWQNIFKNLAKKNLAEKVVVKRRTGGYDGRGQWIVDAGNIDVIGADLFGEVIAEAFIPFDYEISLVGARFKDGSTRFYPITHNLQQNGILRYSVQLNTSDRTLPTLQRQAEEMLSAIMHKLQYVGVMAMECFVIGDQLLINELAPRVHNSGHWTQSGCAVSQFELHLRALLNLPTAQLDTFMPSVMVNLIGTEHNPQWLSVPFSQLHWYGKEVRSGRKVGHINLSHPDKSILIDGLRRLEQLLPADYHSGLSWAMNKLS